MLDLLLIPAAFLLVLALQSARRGDHRLHGYCMTAAFTVVGLRLVLHPRDLNSHHRTLWLILFAAAGTTILLGRTALAWREARSTHSAIPRIHRGFGGVTLAALAITTLAWLLRSRG